MAKNLTDIENGIVEMKKVGTVLKAFNNQTPDFFSPEESQRAFQTVQEIFDSKFEILENAFYKGGEDSTKI